MGNEPSGCGCVSKSWYGCIRCGKESCDETTPHEHSGKYEERSILDDSGCQIRSIRTELQQAREEADQLRSRTFFVSCPWCFENLEGRALFAQIGHVVECGDQIKADHDRLQQQLAQSQEQLRLCNVDQLNCEAERDAIQLRLNEAENRRVKWRSDILFVIARIEALYSKPYPEAHHYLLKLVNEMHAAAAFLATQRKVSVSSSQPSPQLP